MVQKSIICIILHYISETYIFLYYIYDTHSITSDGTLATGVSSARGVEVLFADDLKCN